jgi:hypothetical protein
VLLIDRQIRTLANQTTQNQTTQSLASELLGASHGKTLRSDRLRRISGGLGTSDVDAILAASNCAHPFVIDLRSRPWVEMEDDMLDLAGSQVEALESSQCQGW